jgi:hypothetical protein
MIAYGAAVDLAWDANTEPDLAGYKIHYGTASGDYSHTIDVGNITTYTLTGLEEGVTYYLAATAYDDDDNESDYSDELVHTCINEKPINQNPTTPSIPSGPSTGYTQTSYNFSTTASDPNGDELQYRFDWGDGESSDWGASSQSHSWSSAAIFCIKAQAQDSKGALSAWSDCRNITTTENTHTITTSAGANGSISPSGSLTVNHGSNRTFAISAAMNYHVLDVLVDGVSVGAVTSYTFTNVTRNDYSNCRGQWNHFALRRFSGQPWIQPDVYHHCRYELSCSGCSGGWHLGWSGYFLYLYQCDTKSYDPGKFCHK